MTKRSFNTIGKLALGLSLVATATISGCGDKSQPVNTLPPTRSTSQIPEPTKSATLPQPSPAKQSSEGPGAPFGIQLPWVDLLGWGISISGLIVGGSALLIAQKTSKRIEEAFSRQMSDRTKLADAFSRQDKNSSRIDAVSEMLQDIESQQDRRWNESRQVNNGFRQDLKNLLSRIERVETQVQSHRPSIFDQPIVDGLAPLANPNVAPSLPPLADLATLWAESSPSSANPALDPVQLPAPTGPTKSAYIAALNSGDRQLLRAAAIAELNITSDSESAIATGRSLATELEEVPAGGSYWLIELDREYWLFPTDRTLKGFAAVQPAKGLFRYENQTISIPHLIEPALLGQSGDIWLVKSMGVIAVP